MSLVRTIARSPKVMEALAAYESDLQAAIDLAIAIQQIPAPTFAEGKRARYIEQEFLEAGLLDVSQDEIHNVYGCYPGNEASSPVVITAHTDTVFKSGTDLTVRFENDGQGDAGLIFGPGLADNSLGVAGLILLVRTLRKFRLRTAADLWLVANVREEGLGNLRGMRAVVERFGRASAYLVVEGGSYGHIFHRAIGVRRFRIEVVTPGGHSWGDFGQPNAIHELSQLIVGTEKIRLPQDAKSTYNIGRIEGGTTINTIAAEASCLVDLRSTEKAALEYLVMEVEKLVDSSQQKPSISATMTEIGNRPAGALPLDNTMVRLAEHSLKQVGCRQPIFLGGSTDANVPISLGFASVCIGLARSGNTHRLDEYMDPAQLPQGLGQLLLLTLAAAGFDA